MAKANETQANLLTVDVDVIFATFLEKAGWQGADLEEESKELGSRIGRMKDEIEALTAKIALAETEMAQLSNRETMAKSFLQDAAKAMGKFANEAVLLTALQEEFPSAKPRRGRKAGQATGAKMTVPEVTAVFDVLDAEGKTAGDIAKETTFDSKRNSIVLRALANAGLVQTTGQKRGTRYHQIPGLETADALVKLGLKA